MLQSYSTCPEDRAVLRSNPSAEAGTNEPEFASISTIPEGKE